MYAEKQKLSYKSIFAVALIMILFLLISCMSDKKTKNINSGTKKMLFISHRGESYDAPENTLKAFRLAWQRDTDGIELDIHLSADGQVVCIHDADTERVGDKKLVVAQEDYEALSQVDVGDGEKIPLLSEVIAESPAGKLIFIEIKTGPEILPLLEKIIKSFPNKKQDLRMISFNDSSLKEAKKIFPDIKMYILRGVGWSSEEKRLEPSAEELTALRKEMKVEGFDLSACQDITKEFLSELNTEIVVWTINDLDKARKFISLGADAITSDRAAYLKKYMEQ